MTLCDIPRHTEAGVNTHVAGIFKKKRVIADEAASVYYGMNEADSEEAAASGRVSAQVGLLETVYSPAHTECRQYAGNKTKLTRSTNSVFFP